MTKKLTLQLIVFLLLLTAFTVSATAIVLKQLKTEENRHKSFDKTLIAATLLGKPRPINQFVLTDINGKNFGKENLRGHWTLMFFGFTNCGYVCPTTLAGLNQMYSELQSELPAAQMPQVVMVSVDPERDSVEVMRAFVHKFNKNFIGVRGDIKQTKQLAKQMSAVFTKVVMADGTYMMNHSAEIMLVDPQGNLRAFLPFPHKGPQMANDYMVLINSLSQD